MAETKKSTTAKKTTKQSSASKVTSKKTGSSKSFSEKDKLNLNPIRLDALSMRNKVILVAVIFLILIGLVIYINRGLFVAAMVNGEPISRVSVVSELEGQYGANVLDRVIDRKLIMQEAEAQGVDATQEEIDQERQEVVDRLSGGNQENFQQVLSAQGLTMEEFTEELRLQIIVEKMLGEDVEVADEDVDQFLESNPDLFSEDENEEEARSQVRDQLKQQKLQSQYSEWMQSLREEANIQRFVSY